MKGKLFKEGYEFISKQGERIKIVCRVKNSDPKRQKSSWDLITVEFQDEPFDENGNRVRVTKSASQVVAGKVTNPYHRNAYGIGYEGLPYTDPLKYPNVARMREKWYAILGRVDGRDPHYTNVKICDEWLSFSNFYFWCIKQIGYDVYSVDKDLMQSNRDGILYYSPETCVLVPQSINLCVSDKEDVHRIPTGLSRVWKNDRLVECTIPVMDSNGKTIAIRLGTYANDEDGWLNGFIVSKIVREKKLQILAQRLFDNGLLSKSSYNAMMNYRYKSKYVDMDKVNSILKPCDYEVDKARFINRKSMESAKKGYLKMCDLVRNIPLHFISKLAKQKEGSSGPVMQSTQMDSELKI